MARYHGKGGVVYMGTSGTGVATATVSLSEWTLDMATDKAETTSFGDPNKTYVQGLKDIKGSLSGFWDDTGDNLFTAADSSDGVKMYLYPASTAATKYFYGPAWVDASVTVGVGDSAKVSASFVANGAWGRK